jgi:hypothetical protein
MSLTFDFVNSLIEVNSPQTDILLQDLINDIRTEEATELGITYPQIANASGKEALGTGVSVGITVELRDLWQLIFWAANYIATISGGNLVGGPGGDVIAYSPGVQVLLVLSASSTIVVNNTGSGLSPTEQARLINIENITNDNQALIISM